jgi:formylglycine-generating enzyme required for sulfatase activity
VSWSVSSGDSWLTFSPNNGSNNGTVTVNYTANPETTERTGTITITGGGITQSCSIQQLTELFKMIFIPGGTFTMGDVWGDGYSDELPTHEVTLSSFYISNYEVTQELYLEVMGTNPSYFSGDNLPVEEVSWYDAVEFCNALSQREGLTPAYTISGTSVTWNQNANGYRLPTEAEWEYAAGGGSSNRTKWAGTNNESSLGIYAWYSSNSDNKTHPVGVKEPNSLGLYDMSGNVYEWCWDWYDSGYYSNSPSNNPTGPSTGSDRVLRGGSWGSSGATYCRVADRGSFDPSVRGSYYGFRLLRNAE